MAVEKQAKAENAADQVPEAKKKPRRGARKKKAGKRMPRAPKSDALGKAWTFPKVGLESAIALAQAIEEKNAGNPLDAGSLAPMVGYRKADDWRFLDILRASNQYGLVEGAGKTAKVSLTPTGSDIVAPSSPDQRQSALLAAFRKVELFERVEKFYSGKKIPEDEYFGNTLVRDFEVPRERVETFIRVFTGNLEYLKGFLPGGILRSESVSAMRVPQAGTDNAARSEGPSPTGPREGETVREFLDTCFILMPFGNWFDRYYQEIYVPATKEAGFEPLRADSLFNVGSVMEQIWGQIRKAKVLLAELTGKNANVFYELGLAHAAKKPVVFISGDIDDVPFDVRHLRVIVYDVREPQWAEKLKKDITAYLKNTRTEPERAIPQPFREDSGEVGDTAATSAASQKRGRKADG